LEWPNFIGFNEINTIALRSVVQLSGRWPGYFFFPFRIQWLLSAALALVSIFIVFTAARIIASRVGN